MLSCCKLDSAGTSGSFWQVCFVPLVLLEHRDNNQSCPSRVLQNLLLLPTACLKETLASQIVVVPVLEICAAVQFSLDWQRKNCKEFKQSEDFAGTQLVAVFTSVRLNRCAMQCTYGADGVTSRTKACNPPRIPDC